MADGKIVMIDGRLTVVMEPGDVQWSQPCDPTAWDTQAPHDEAAFTTDNLQVISRERWFLSYPAGVAPYAPYAPADAADAADGDVRPPPDAPIDRVLGDLAADRIGKADRRRIGDALDAANERADGTRAKPDEAFGRILRGDGTARLGIVTP